MLTGPMLFTLFATSLALILVIYVRARKREGLRPLEMTEKDKSQLREFRTEMAPGKLAAQVIGGLGMIGLVASFIPSDTPFSWRDRFAAAGAGVGLILLAVWLAKPRSRPRYWWATVWGMACAVCWIIMFIGAVIVIKTPGPRENVPQWVWATMALAIIVGSLGAVLTIIYGIGALIGQKSGSENPPANPTR